MADNFRYAFGETNPVSIATKSGVPISIGDLSWEDANDGFTIKPANAFAWTTDLPTTQTAFAAVFVGVNMQSWDGTNLVTGNKDGTNRVATGGTFNFACAAGSTFNPGDLVGPDALNQQLLPQQVVKVASRGLAIGRVERAVTSASAVLVRIFSGKYAPLTNA